MQKYTNLLLSTSVLYKHSGTSCQGGLPGRVVLLVRREETENEELQHDPAERALLEILRPGDSRLFRRARHRNLDHFVDRDPAVPTELHGRSKTRRAVDGRLPVLQDGRSMISYKLFVRDCSFASLSLSVHMHVEVCL